MYVFANMGLNMGIEEPNPNIPAIPVLNTAPPIADFETQEMVLDMENADCAKLTAMNHEVKQAFFLSNISLQRPGTLSKIVGPDCQYLGEVEEIAAITDDTLTLGEDREILYHIPEMEALIVSYKENDTIAYGMFIEEEIAPLEYFLAYREDAERSAAVAQSYAKAIADIELPTFDPSKKIAPRRDSQSSAVKAEKATRSRSREEFTATSVAPSTFDTPGFTPPSTIPTPSLPSDTPSEVTQNDPEIIYVDAPPTDSLPSIKPLGPVPQSETSNQNIGYWAFMIFLALVLIITAIVVIRSQASAKKGMIDK
jgi:hypothetical protein